MCTASEDKRWNLINQKWFNIFYICKLRARSVVLRYFSFWGWSRIQVHIALPLAQIQTQAAVTIRVASGDF